MNKILLSLLLSFGIVQGATEISTTAIGTNTVLLSSGGYVLKSLTFIPAGTNTTYRLYDFDNKVLTWTNDAYTVKYLTNATVVSTFVDYSGVTNSITNTSLIWATNTIAAATNTYSPFAVYGAAGSAVTTFDDLNIPLAKGLTLSNSHAGTVVYTYTQQ